MTSGTALWKGDTWRSGWAELSLAQDGALSLRSDDGIATTNLELGASAFVDTFAEHDWLSAVGASAHEVVVGHRAGPRLDVVAKIPRLERTGATRFDAHALRFHSREGRNQCVLAWEIGIALIDPRQGLVWSFVHDDVDQRILAVTDQTVELVGVERAFTIEMSDGSARVRTRRDSLDFDPETMAEWRRGIGR